MPNDQSDGGGRKKARDKQELSEEAIARVKRSILFGTYEERPLKSTRFKKGQSGNPAGRPKRPDLGYGNSRSANVLAFREGERLIGVREGGEVGQIAGIEAVLRKQYASALGGNAYAQKHIVERYDWAEREQRQQRMDRIEIWESYVATQRQAIADAKAKGEALPTELPHPDDVVIDYEKGVTIIGPLNEKELAQFQETMRVRDALIMQGALDRREWDTRNTGDPLDGPGAAILFALFINQHLPQRYKLSETEIEMRMMRHGTLSKRELLKQLYRAWRAIGAPAHRGKKFPPLRFAKQLIEQLGDYLTQPLAMRDA